MSKADKSAPAAPKAAADPKTAAPKGAAMKDADLDKVAGGLNPQPLPPIIMDKR
jgi:hypothetical protein